MRTSFGAATATKIPSAVVMQAMAAHQAAEPVGLALRLGKGETLFAEGEVAEYFYRVTSGTVRTYKLLNDGRRQINAFYLVGDIFAIEAGREHRFSAEAVDDVMVTAWRRSRLDGIVQDHPAFGERVMSMIRSLERAQDHMLLLGRKTAQEKIATFLIDLAERMDEDERIELPMPRSDIADHLGLTIETVSRTLSDLGRQGLIRLAAGSRSVVLANKPGLQHLNG
jgi:CRP/FNR family nitrogen fixation transcriptional regulator